MKQTSDRMSQMAFPFPRPFEDDRNFHLGGRSFYFFDFDDNVVYLSTPIVIFHKTSGEEMQISSGDLALHHQKIGSEGIFKNYYIDANDTTGSFRYFRDLDLNIFDRVIGKKQHFIDDIKKAIQQATHSWQAPSWHFFYHAIFNGRPISVITARGHHVSTIKGGINLLVKAGHLPKIPNYLSIYPVSNSSVRKELGDAKLSESVAELKKSAIRKSVATAIEKYGHSPYHRFGMSDDDPKNVELITEEMQSLKRLYPEMSFFVIRTYRDSYEKNEILPHSTKKVNLFSEQMNLFEGI